MLGRHRALESDAVRLGELVAMAMLDEVKPLLLLERGLEILGPAQQASLTLLADPSLEYGLDEHRAMALDEPLDLILARIRPQDLGSREADEPQHSAAVEHARDLHVRAPSFIPLWSGFLLEMCLGPQTIRPNKKRTIVTLMAPPMRAAICAKGKSADGHSLAQRTVLTGGPLLTAFDWLGSAVAGGSARGSAGHSGLGSSVPSSSSSCRSWRFSNGDITTEIEAMLLARERGR